MDVTPRLGLDAAISHHASGSVTYQVGSDTRTGRVRFWSFQMGVSLRGPRRGLSGALNERKPAHAVFNTDGLARGLCNPLEPPASRAAGRPLPNPSPVRSWRGGRHPASTPGAIRTRHAAGLGDMVSVAGGVGSRVAASRREPCDSPWTSAGARTCRGSRGRSPSSAPAGDPRSVAPKGRLALST